MRNRTEESLAVPSSPQLLTLADLHALYRLPRTSAYRLIAAGVLKAKKSGKRVLFDVRDVEAWRESLPAVRLGASGKDGD